ncbi:aminoglycoside phosphotransferase family protein [Kitasatospora sp. NPDC098652]|uniref:aminoglycoside phosphotransferase family protein n=1 Tax=Kitasatospora sp. NPDC098652 TaxID=3364095 RepID=UPI003813E0C8
MISGDGRAFYAKQHHSSLLHQREVHAYRHWTPALGTGHAPVLLAADEQTRCVLLSELPGRPLGPDRLESALARTVNLRAGTLLRSFHEAEPPRHEPPAITGTALATQRLAGIAGMLSRADEELVLGLAADLDAVLPELGQVPTHGDLWQHQFVISPAGDSLGLLDFERSAWRPAIRDLVRFEYGGGMWDGHRDLRAAFLDGYGRALTSAEEAAEPGFAVLTALFNLRWGKASQNRVVLNRGWRTIERLRGSRGAAAAASIP